MAPIPQKKKTRPRQAGPVRVSTDNVVDEYGQTLTYLQARQNRVDRDQTRKTAINRQHAAQYESDINKNKLIYRDVFPGRKYKLTLSDTSWMGGSNVVTIGYTVGDTFTQISSTATPPEDNVFSIEIPFVAAVDTLEIRLTGAGETVRSYIEDNTTSDSIGGAMARLIDSVADLISGQDDLEDDIREIKDKLQELDDRVTALEKK